MIGLNDTVIERDVRLSNSVWVTLHFSFTKLFDEMQDFVGLWGVDPDHVPVARIRVRFGNPDSVACANTDLVARGDNWMFRLGDVDAEAVFGSVDIAPWQIACPLRQMFSWILDRHEGVLVHAAGVFMRNGTIALIAGPSGSGKSSLAAAIARSKPFSYLGDDWVPVYKLPNKAWGATGLYRSLKLSSAMADVCRLSDPRFTTSRDKQVFRVKDMAIGGDHTIGSVVVPSIADDSLVVKKIEPKEAVKRIAPSTLLQSSGVTSASLDRIALLCEAVPCYSLSMSSEFLRSVHVLVQELF